MDDEIERLEQPTFTGYPLSKEYLDWIEQEVNDGCSAVDFYDTLMQHARHTLTDEGQEAIAQAFAKTAEDVLTSFGKAGGELKNLILEKP